MESIYELMSEPLSIFVSLLVGLPLFTIGVSSMGVYAVPAFVYGSAYSTVLVFSLTVMLVGFIFLTFGFMGLGENIIEEELKAKGYL